MTHVAAPPTAVGGRPMSLTVDDLLALPDEGRGYELVDGTLVERQPMGAKADKVTMRI